MGMCINATKNENKYGGKQPNTKEIGAKVWYPKNFRYGKWASKQLNKRNVVKTLDYDFYKV